MNATELQARGHRSASRGEKRQGPLSHKTEGLLHTILANVDDLIAVVDLEGRRLYNSPSYAAIFGGRERMRGTDSFSEIHPDDRDMVRRVFQETIATGVGRRIVYRFTVPDRPVRYIESQGNVIRDGNGNVANVVIVSRDITERKRSEEERARLDRAVEQTSESIVITDTDGRIVYVNPAFERQSGYMRDEVIGQTPRILKSGLHDESVYKTLWATLRRGETWTGEFTNRRKNGTLYLEETTISPVRDASGAIINFVAVKRDLTYKRQVEIQMQQAQKMASLGQLAEGIAHDINNILNVLAGVFGLLEPRLQDPLLSRYLSLARDAIQKGSNVGRRLMEFSQTDSSDLKPLAVGSLVATLKSTLFRTVERAITIDASVGRDLPLIQGDEGRVFQSLLTLCLNARDGILAAPGNRQNGTISISADTLEGRFVRNRFSDATAETYVRIRVADDGVGMTAEVRKHIFEPFFTMRERANGSGLGLAMVYSSMKAHRGFVEFESEPDRGTTFELYFPALHIENEEPILDPSGPPKGGPETLLLVEDEEGLRFVLEQSLRSVGYTVLVASDGFEGYAIYAQHQDEIAAVITDMGLPRESGYDMYLRIRALDPNAKAIFVSGYFDPTLRSKLSVAGATGFLAKPFSPAALLAKLREVLDQNV